MYGSSYAKGQGSALFNHFAKLLVNFNREILEHFLLIEHVLAKVVRGTLCGRLHFDRALLERLFYDFKTKVTHKLSCMYEMGVKFCVVLLWGKGMA